MKAKFNLPEKQVYIKILNVLNSFYDSAEEQLTSTEIDLLSEFLILPRERFQYQPFSTLAKNKVIENCAKRDWILSRENINNKIYSLVKKGYLWRDEDRVIYLTPALRKMIDLAKDAFENNQKFTFEIEFKLSTEDQDNT